MLAGLKFNSSFRAFRRSRLTKVAVATLVLLPLLYSALYLWAFWDPFGKINQVPVALVNSDRGAEVDGEPLHAGERVVEGLHDNDEILWIDATAEEAREGVASGTFYFSLELPENFSQAVSSPTTDNPEKAQLITQYNDANGYLSTMIGQNVMRVLLNVVNEQISAQAVDQLLVGIMNAGDGLDQAANGAGKLADGAQQLNDGSGQLNDGAKRLHDGLAEAKNGSSQLASGTRELDNGIGQLQDGAGTLSEGTQQLADRVGEAQQKIGGAAGGISRLVNGIDALGDGAQEIDSGVAELRQQASTVTDFQAEQAQRLRGASEVLNGEGSPATREAARILDEVAVRLEQEGLGPDSQNKADIDRLAQGTSRLSQELNDNDSQLRGGLSQLESLPPQFTELADGVNQINDGAHLLDDKLGEAGAGVTRLRDGAQQLDEGNSQLLQGAESLVDGTDQAQQGTAELSEGADELHERLAQGSQQVPRWDPAQREVTADTIGGPVGLTSHNDSGSNTFGAGLAPFFFSLALFIGGIMAFSILTPLHARTINSGISAWRAALDGFLPSALIAIGQAIVVVLVTVWGVGLHAANLPGLIAFAILVSLVFMAINHMFIAGLGVGPGRVAALCFLMLQMVSSGGLYPVETQNWLMQAMHPFNPMTYAINGYRQLMYGFYDERLPIAIAVLIGVGLLAFTITSLTARSQRTWTIKRLHPVL